MKRTLGVDLGTERTGIAVGSFGVAHPLTVLESNDENVIIAGIARLAREEDARDIVIGLARTLQGKDGPSAERQRAIAARVEKETGLPVHLWDERFTTKEADASLLGAGLSRQERRKRVDKVAATLLLQNYFDAHPGAGAER